MHARLLGAHCVEQNFDRRLNTAAAKLLQLTVGCHKLFILSSRLPIVVVKVIKSTK